MEIVHNKKHAWNVNNGKTEQAGWTEICFLDRIKIYTARFKSYLKKKKNTDIDILQC